MKHLLVYRIKGRPPKLDLELHPRLPKVSVQATRAGYYLTLFSERRAV